MNFPVAHLSVSSVNEYMGCAACWKGKRLGGLPRRVSPSLVIGSALHGALAALRTGGTSDDAIGAAELEASRCMAGEDRTGELGDADPMLDLGSKFSSWSAVEDEYLRLLPHIGAVVDSEAGYEVTEVEARLDFESLFSVPFLGFADVILHRDGHAVVKDFKSTGKSGLPDDSTWRQLAIYSMAVDCREVGVDQLVTNKTPVVHTWLTDGYRGRVTDELRDSVREQVEHVITGITLGDFPVGSGGKYGHDIAHPTVFFSVPEMAVA